MGSEVGELGGMAERGGGEWGSEEKRVGRSEGDEGSECVVLMRDGGSRLWGSVDGWGSGGEDGWGSEV